jgi:hypothetical protein
VLWQFLQGSMDGHRLFFSYRSVTRVGLIWQHRRVLPRPLVPKASSPICTKSLPAAVVHDPKDPGLGLITVTEGGRTATDLHEGILHHVIGIGSVPHDRFRQAPGYVYVSLEEFFHGEEVTLFPRLQKFCVGLHIPTQCRHGSHGCRKP